MTYTAISVAEWIVGESARRNWKITPSRLQAMLYYCQGEFLGMTGQPLFDDPILACEHGPVVPSAYDEYKRYGENYIDPCNSTAPGEIEGFIRHCVKEKAPLGDCELGEMTRNEPPYRLTPHGKEISRESMKKFFEVQFYAPDEEDAHDPCLKDEKETIKAIAEHFTEEELDELISAL